MGSTVPAIAGVASAGMARIVFLHGLEGTATGSKPTWLKNAGHDVTAPVLDTRDLITWLSDLQARDGMPSVPTSTIEKPLQAAKDALAVGPDVVVGSSFGGGLALLLQSLGLWRGPMVLLAPAGTKLFGLTTLTTTAPVAILHGRNDDVVPVDDSKALAASAVGDVVLRLVDDDHRLLASVEAGLMGDLVDVVTRRR